MDVYSTLDGQVFVWDSEKASGNLAKHQVRFEQAREALLDPLGQYQDASVANENRQMCVGLTRDYRLLCVVHLVREDAALRIISARRIEPSERRKHEKHD